MNLNDDYIYQIANQYQVFKSSWQGQTVVRCRICWMSMIRDGVADNNGWFPYESYPHAEWCRENRQSTRK